MVILPPGFLPNGRQLLEMLSRAWSWTRNFFSRHHVAAMFALTWATLKTAFWCIETTLQRLVQAENAIKSAVQQANNMATGAGLVAGVFDLCNAIFPIWEFFVLVSLLFTVKAALWGVSLIRYLYKQIPLKGT